MSERQALAAVGLRTADILDDAGAEAAASVVRRMARELAYPTVEPGRCRGCTGPLSGRQRQWCSEACRCRWRRATGLRPAL